VRAGEAVALSAVLTYNATAEQTTILKGADRDKVSAKAVRKELQVSESGRGGGQGSLADSSCSSADSVPRYQRSRAQGGD
jgi:hypothetical protein